MLCIFYVRSVLYILFNCVVLCIYCVCKCVLYYCHRVSTQLKLTNIYKKKKIGKGGVACCTSVVGTRIL